MTQWQEQGGKEVTVGRGTDGRLLCVAVSVKGNDVSNNTVLTTADVSDTKNLLELCRDKVPANSVAADCKAVYIVEDQGRLVQVMDYGEGMAAVCTDVTASVYKCLAEFEEGPYKASPQQAPTAGPYKASPQQAPTAGPYKASPQQAPAAGPYKALPQQSDANTYACTLPLCWMRLLPIRAAGARKMCDGKTLCNSWTFSNHQVYSS